MIKKSGTLILVHLTLQNYQENISFLYQLYKNFVYFKILCICGFFLSQIYQFCFWAGQRRMSKESSALLLCYIVFKHNQTVISGLLTLSQPFQGHHCPSFSGTVPEFHGNCGGKCESVDCFTWLLNLVHYFIHLDRSVLNGSRCYKQPGSQN